LLTELKAAFLNKTLKLIANPNFTDKDHVKPEALNQAFEDHIRESTNPSVTVLEFFKMKKQPHKLALHLNTCINKKLNKVDFTEITDLVITLA
jgi:hypothetical protein